MTDTSRGAQIVKPLEWEYHPNGTMAADNVGHSYIISTKNTARPYFLKWPQGFAPDVETIEEAKAAAQADFEQRVLDAINPDFLTRAETAEARLAEAVAFITWIEKTMVKNITENGLERPRLKLDGEYHTGPVVDWAHKVLIGMRDLSTATLTKIKGETDDE